MGNRRIKAWYYTKPQAISKYLFTVFSKWGYYVFWNQSDDSESFYLKVNLGTKESPKPMHIRISNHSIPQNNRWVLYDVDLYCGFEREGATSYIKLLSKMANLLNKPLPHVLEHVKTGTPLYKTYRITMQNRKKLAYEKGYRFQDDRLYL